MNRFSRKLSILAVGLAMGVAVPSLSVRAADDDGGGGNNKVVQKSDVPAAVRDAIQARIPAGAEVTEYVRRGNGANQTFAAHFKQPGQKGQQKIFVSATGQFLLGPVPGDEKVTQAQLDRAAATAAPGVATPAAIPAPAVGSMTPEQARAEINRLQARESELATDIDRANVEINRQDQRMRDIQSRGGANANAEIDQVRAQQQELGRKRDAEQAELAQNEQRQREVAAAAGIPLPTNPQLANARLPAGAAGAGGLNNANSLYERDRDDQAANPRLSRVTADQVPPAARTALEKYTRGQRDVEYRRDEENGKVFYTAHYVTDDGNRHWLTVAENGTTRIGPKISAYTTGQGTDIARTASGREPAVGGPDAGYRTIPQGDVPKAVVQGSYKAAEGQGGHDFQYLRSERGGQTYYSVIYTDKNNRRMEARLDDKGNVVEQPHAAREQPAGVNDRAADRDRNVPGRETPAANTPRSIEQRDVPKAVITTVTREANNQGGHNWQYFRVGQDDYLVRYTTKDNRQMETRIDNSGKVVEAPHAVK